MEFSRAIPIFSVEEQDQNQGRKQALLHLVSAGEAVILVGAGLSQRVGYPSWYELLAKMEKLANQCADGFMTDEAARQEAPLDYVRRIKKHIKDHTGNLRRYEGLLYTEFKLRDPAFDQIHRQIVTLPFRGVLTTNYDGCLEAALSRVSHETDNSLVLENNTPGPRLYEFVQSLNGKLQIKRIAHLHGKFDRPETIVLDTDDYQHLYGFPTPPVEQTRGGLIEMTTVCRLLWDIFVNHPVVFVGFSLEDPYFRALLDILANDLGRWGNTDHWAIMDICPDSADRTKFRASTLQQQYGVGVVFYENPDRQHRGLDHLFDEIENRSTGRVASTSLWLDTTNRRMMDRMGGNDN